MSLALFVMQCLNGLQLGVLLFLMAAGLTLVFGIMNFVNLAHGSLYMMGAFIAASVYNHTGSFGLAALALVPAMLAIGLAVEYIALKKLYDRDHLDQVLATFGLILFFNELARMIWGASPYYMEVPDWLSGTIDLFGITYPAYRFLIIVVGLAVAGGCYLLIHKTRLGMLIRAGADDREMVDALGVNVRRLYTILFGLGGALCGLAGVMAAPLLAIEIGMGERVLITTFVVIVIGGVGSIRGALVGALLVGMVDSMGRAYLPQLMQLLLPPSTADTLSAGLVSASVYVLMAVVLLFRPLGLLAARG